MSQFKPPLPLGHRTRESTLFMAEKFAFDQCLRQSRAVDFDERLLCSGALGVKGAGHKFLAGSAFALDEYGDLCLGDSLDQRTCFLDQATLAEDFTVGIVHSAIRHGSVGLGDVVEITRLVQGNFNLLARKGLGQIVKSPSLEAFQHKGIGFAVDQWNDQRLFGALVEVAEEIEQLAFRQLGVDKNQVELILAKVIVDVLNGSRLSHVDSLVANKLSHCSTQIFIALGQYDLLKWHLVQAYSFKLSGVGTSRRQPTDYSVAKRVTYPEEPCHAEVSIFRSPCRASLSS